MLVAAVTRHQVLVVARLVRLEVSIAANSRCEDKATFRSLALMDRMGLPIRGGASTRERPGRICARCSRVAPTFIALVDVFATDTRAMAVPCRALAHIRTGLVDAVGCAGETTEGSSVALVDVHAVTSHPRTFVSGRARATDTGDAI